jgi:hypothetical protein
MLPDMITKNNYLEKVSEYGVERLTGALKETHEFLKEATSDFSDWSLYEDDPDIKETTRIYFEKLEKLIGRNSETEIKKDNRKSGQEKESDKIHKKTKSQAAHQTNHDTNVKKIERVEHLEEEIKFIKRFVGLHNRTKSKNAILNFIKAVQKAIVQKIIRKTSKYAKEIQYIQKTLVEAFNNAKGDISFVIHKDNLPNFVAIAGGEEVFHSIGMIKRFIGMEGKPVELQKRQNFIKFIENAFKKQKLKDDPYEDKVKAILKELKKTKSEKIPVVIEHEELKGLHGILNGCGCKGIGNIYHTGGKKLRQCHSKNYSDAHKGACSHHHGLSGVVTAEEILNQHYEMLPFSGKWKELMGQPAKNFTLMLHGEPGSGKTTFMMMFVKYLSGFGSVLFISSEEFGSPTLQSKIKDYLNPVPENVHFAGSVNNADLSGYQFIVMDSINDLGLSLDDFKNLKAKNPDTAFIFLVQHTKNGQFRGSKEWEHEAQIVAEVSEGTITITKNRYGVMGTMPFFNKVL